MTTYAPLTAEERAEAKRAAEIALHDAAGDPHCTDCAEFPLVEVEANLSRWLLRALADLEAVERERDEAKDLVIAEHTDRIRAERERDAARAQVAALAEALRWYADDSNWHPEWHEAELAKAALTQAGLGPAAAGVEEK